MKVSIIGGTGPQGLGIGERLAIAGVDVIIGSRKEEKALEVVAKAKEDLADYDISMVGMANEDAAKEGDVLIITVPLAAQKPTVEGIKECILSDTVTDTVRIVDDLIGEGDVTLSILGVILALDTVGSSHIGLLGKELVKPTASERTVFTGS